MTTTVFVEGVELQVEFDFEPPDAGDRDNPPSGDVIEIEAVTLPAGCDIFGWLSSETIAKLEKAIRAQWQERDE